MALNKKQKNKIVLATLLSAILIEGSVIYYINENNNKLKDSNSQLERDINSLKYDINKKNNTIKDINKSNTELEKENQELKDIKENLEKKNKDLSEKLAVKKQKEVTAELLSAEYPTSRSAYQRGTPIRMTLSFYGDFAHENGGYSTDAQGNKLVAGTVASNAYSFGTQFYFNGQIFTVRDRGGSSFSSSNRLDVFVPRQNGESDYEYKQRIKQYGKRTVTMYKL